jgi:3'-phosphoadenosine 5'-phosphosulfate (PAPS) 3'-phosphatase
MPSIKIAERRGISMINNSTDFHYIGPGSLLVEEAGGQVTGLNGEALDYAHPIDGVIFTNCIVHEDFI